jgi:serine/threonine protein kinase
VTLSSGTRLGPYEILAPIGAGGMGEVYRAHDPRLGRDVAIKVLPAHLSAIPEVRARFEREARAISHLNHPHICALHDLGHHDGTDFLAVELLEGEALAHRTAATQSRSQERHARPLEMPIGGALECLRQGEHPRLA